MPFTGAVYLDLPATLLTQTVDESKIVKVAPCPPPPLLYPDARLIGGAVELLMRAKKPLVIIGKGKTHGFRDKLLSNFSSATFYLLYDFFFAYIGAAYAHAEDAARELIYSTDVPFLPTPMGKGVVPDGDVRCVSSARTYALLHCDVILLLGARLNWMLHFGRSPRYQNDVKIIQVNR